MHSQPSRRGHGSAQGILAVWNRKAMFPRIGIIWRAWPPTLPSWSSALRRLPVMRHHAWLSACTPIWVYAFGPHGSMLLGNRPCLPQAHSDDQQVQMAYALHATAMKQWAPRITMGGILRAQGALLAGSNCLTAQKKQNRQPENSTTNRRPFGVYAHTNGTQGGCPLVS